MQQQDPTTFPAESFTDWLSGECMHIADVAYLPQLRDVTGADLVAQTPAALLALAFDAGQPAATRIAALEALRTAHELCRAADEAEYQAKVKAGFYDAIWGDTMAKFTALQLTRVAA